MTFSHSSGMGIAHVVSCYWLVTIVPSGFVFRQLPGWDNLTIVRQIRINTVAICHLVGVKRADHSESKWLKLDI